MSTENVSTAFLKRANFTSNTHIQILNGSQGVQLAHRGSQPQVARCNEKKGRPKARSSKWGGIGTAWPVNSMVTVPLGP